MKPNQRQSDSPLHFTVLYTRTKLNFRDWKVLQSSIVPPKPPPAARRGRAMEAFSNLFEPMPHHRRPGAGGRRLTIGDTAPYAPAIDLEEPEPDPRRRGVYAGLTLAEATRRGMEDDPSRQQSAARRLGTATHDRPSDQSLGGWTTAAALEAGGGGGGGSSNRPRLATRTSSTTSTLDQHSQRQRQWEVSAGAADRDVTGGAGHEIGIARHARQARPSLQVRTGSHQSASGVGGADVRRSITTSRALTSRQDRYRNAGGSGSGSRDNAFLVDSDSD